MDMALRQRASSTCQTIQFFHLPERVRRAMAHEKARPRITRYPAHGGLAAGRGR